MGCPQPGRSSLPLSEILPVRVTLRPATLACKEGPIVGQGEGRQGAMSWQHLESGWLLFLGLVSLRAWVRWLARPGRGAKGSRASLSRNPEAAASRPTLFGLGKLFRKSLGLLGGEALLLPTEPHHQLQLLGGEQDGHRGVFQQRHRDEPCVDVGSIIPDEPGRWRHDGPGRRGIEIAQVRWIT